MPRFFAHSIVSPSSRRAWIEILTRRTPASAGKVALLAEGVDRNLLRSAALPLPWVALLAEGVDRNLTLEPTVILDLWSPSSRRAWIEIDHRRFCGLRSCVALLAEGVDRNTNLVFTVVLSPRSPSSRRAWIEIVFALYLALRFHGRPPRGGRG